MVTDSQNNPTIDSIDVVLFDVGNVLIRLNYDRIFRIWAEPGNHDPVKLRSKFEITEAFCEYERGHIGTEEYLVTLNQMLGTDLELAKFREGWNAIFDGEIDSMAELLDDVRDRARIHAFSNTNVDHVTVFGEYSRLLDKFERVFVSNDVGERKPDKAAFDKVIGEIGVAPARVLFLDDVQDNVDGAIVAGLKAVQFVDAARARSDISRYLDLPAR